MVGVIGILMAFLIAEAIFGYFQMSQWEQVIETIYTIIIVAVMTKFIFTTKYFVDKKLEKKRIIFKPLSLRLKIKITSLFIIVGLNLLVQTYRLIEDFVVCLAYLGVKGLNLEALLIDEELERLVLSVIDLFTSLTLLFIYHKLG